MTDERITRLPTRFGQKHADAIAFFQDVVLPALIENRLSTLVLRGVLDDGNEVHFTLMDMTNDRTWNTRTLGLLTEASVEYAQEMQQYRPAPEDRF